MNTRPVHVLLVEDDEVDAEAVSRAFLRRLLLHSLTHVTNGLEALAVLRGEAGQAALPRPYLILLDLNMPRMNGLEFLQVLRQDPVLKSSVVFVLTTSDAEADKQAAYDARVAGYVLKQKAGGDFSDLLQLLHEYQQLVQMPI